MKSTQERPLSSGREPAGSHGARRHTRNKKSDPFLELSNDFTTTAQPNPRSPKGEDGGREDQQQQRRSLLVDLVLTPLNMVTFILSLFLVDQQQARWRLSQRASTTPTWRSQWPYFHAEPYQDSGTSTWGHSKKSSSSSDRPAAQRTGSFQGWYARKKKGAIAKLEIGDALEMRSRVLVALIAWTVLGSLALFYAARRVYSWMAA